MRRSLFESKVLLIVLLLAVFAGSVAAVDVRTKSTTLGVKGGFNFGGDFWIGPRNPGCDLSFTLGGFADYKLGEKILGSASLDLHNFSILDESAMMFDLAVGLKALLYSPKSKITFRPGVFVGYGNLGSAGGLDGSSYLTLKGSLEVVVQSGPGMAWLVDASIFGAPTGGNDAADMSFGPLFLLRGGLIF